MSHSPLPAIVIWVVLCQSLLAAEQPTPADQYQALLKEFQNASSAGQLLTDEERLAFVGKVFRLRNELAGKFLELAEQYPQDPIAVDALLQAVWHVNTTPWPVELVGRNEAGTRVLELLQRQYIHSEKLGPLCQRIALGFCSEYEQFLRAALEQSPHPGVQAEACLGLAQYLSNRRQRIELIKDQPQLQREFADLFGEPYFAQLQQQDGQAVEQEVEQLLERAEREFGELPTAGGATIAEKAAAKLFELRHLVVGKMAPDIEGLDQDGMPFKLSDYRGQVVLLDFWSEY